VASFFMQPGSYRVELYATVQGCGQVTAQIDSVNTASIWTSSGANASPCNPSNIGLLAKAVIFAFNVNQNLQFLFSSPGLIVPSATLILTKLQ
jgi:hypothetical protein